MSEAAPKLAVSNLRRFRPYSGYKPSGIEWFGDVPIHWRIKRSDRFVSTERTQITPEQFSGKDVFHYSIPTVQETGTGAVEEGEQLASAKQLVTRPVLLVSKLNPRKATICLASPKELVTVCSGEFVALTATNCNLKFLYYLFMSEPFRQRLDANVQSVTRSHQRANPEQIYRFWAAWPPTAEQNGIADFLDRETANIDDLIARKRLIIEKLKEKRSTLISHTVTRSLPPDAARAAGLDPHPQTKSSGVNWFANVPAHWEVTQLRRKVLVLDCKHKTVSFIDDGIPVVSIREISGLEVKLEGAKQTTPEEYRDMIEGERKPLQGDIIYSRNATVGDAALVTVSEPFCMGQDVCLIRSLHQNARYLLYLFRSTSLLQQVESLMIGSTFRRINVGQIKAFWVCIPPVREQELIATYLDHETAEVDRTIQRIQDALDCLLEYRVALITATVTGTIDVGGEEYA